ncbi:MAG: NAD(P)H-hydrate dehydratase [Acidobacteriota bacterium]|nr:NAD(P)H-hydrate dehydratase [Acidobacteriota bacterium]
MKILTAAQMGEVDRLTTERFRIPSVILMENAGRRCAEELAAACPDLVSKRIAVLCGRGNNGGDGFVVARHLALGGARPEVFLCAKPESLKGDALTNYRIAEAMRIPVQTLPDGASVAARFNGAAAPCADVIVDALFGTGLSKPVGADFLPALAWVERSSPHAFVMAVDIPSGLMADMADVPGPSVKADLTVTFSALKPAHVLSPARERMGRIVLTPIGSPAALYDDPGYRWNLIDREQVRRILPSRPRSAHKGAFGHVYVAAGSGGKSGAAFMAALAALRAGAGLVTLWLPDGLRQSVAGRFPELMTEFLPETPEGTIGEMGAEELLTRLSLADALVLGPGMTTHPATQVFIREMVRRSPVPVVVDADALNSFALVAEPFENENGQPIVLTPHPGEMARLCGQPVPSVQRRRVETALAAAARHRCFVVLKGHQTLIAAPDGRLFVNTTGNPGMATGGTGDILAGMVGRFVAAWHLGAKGDRAALPDHLSAAVYLHGLAGDIAAGEGSEESLVATDLIEHLPKAFREVGR